MSCSSLWTASWLVGRFSSGNNTMLVCLLVRYSYHVTEDLSQIVTNLTEPESDG